MTRNRPVSAQTLLDTFAQDLQMAATFFAKEHDLETKDVVATVFDLRDERGKRLAKQVASLSKGEAELIRLQGDVNQIAQSDQRHICALLVKRDCLSESATVLEKALRGEGDERRGALIVSAGRGGYRFAQEKDSL